MTAATKEEEAWQDGYEAALESVAPLLEAARAYRDAHEHYMKNALDQGAWAKRVNAASDLARAARTFEGHVEEGRE